MAASIPGLLSDKLRESIQNCSLLVVGAGGIGCELLKNLVLTDFKNITLIDLDTIDVSNLNRQFLFQKKHVGKSKAEVAKETALKFNPDCNIKAYHDSIFNTKYDTEFFRSFTMVLNALDNKAARNHVNRMCLAADVPLVESGTAGYFGQVTVIKKAVTECYECQPKAGQKTFPGCTIRNTPSEPIHCIVWAKHLFNQLFGEADPDEDVTPDVTEIHGKPDLADNDQKALEEHKANSERITTRVWAVVNKYDPRVIFNKLFCDDIHYLRTMDKLWETRRPPTPLDFENLPDKIAENGGDGHSTGENENGMRDLKVWSVKECATYFSNCVTELKQRLGGDADQQKEGQLLVWDKDDESCMDFVTACANIRAHIFGIPLKSRFDIKSMAGNIIPAIATTNAIIAGLIVVEAIKVLEGKIKQCKTIYLNRQPNYRKKILVPCELEKPNPKCYVCSPKSEVTIKLNCNDMTVKTFEDKVLKASLNMVAPDVEIEDGKGTIIISSEEGETEENNNKKLSVFGIRNNSRLKCDDFLQVFQLIINIWHFEECEDGKEFELIGDLEKLKAQQLAESSASADDAAASSSSNKPQSSSEIHDVDEDLIVMDIEEPSEPAKKRKRSSNDDSPQKKKVAKTALNDDAIDIS